MTLKKITLSCLTYHRLKFENFLNVPSAMVSMLLLVINLLKQKQDQQQQQQQQTRRSRLYSDTDQTLILYAIYMFVTNLVLVKNYFHHTATIALSIVVLT